MYYLFCTFVRYGILLELGETFVNIHKEKVEVEEDKCSFSWFRCTKSNIFSFAYPAERYFYPGNVTMLVSKVQSGFSWENCFQWSALLKWLRVVCQDYCQTLVKQSRWLLFENLFFWNESKCVGWRQCLSSSFHSTNKSPVETLQMGGLRSSTVLFRFGIERVLFVSSAEENLGRSAL